ncbi:MAG: hypothetical protein U1A78_33865 [Polyangia bacterium]
MTRYRQRRWVCRQCPFTYRGERYPQHEHPVALLCDNDECQRPARSTQPSCSDLCGLRVARRRLGLADPQRTEVGRGQWLFEERQRLRWSRSQLVQQLKRVGATAPRDWRAIFDLEVRDGELPRPWATELAALGFPCAPFVPEPSPPPPSADAAAPGARAEAPAPAPRAAPKAPAESEPLPPLTVSLALGCEDVRLGAAKVSIPAVHVLNGLAWLSRKLGL